MRAPHLQFPFLCLRPLPPSVTRTPRRWTSQSHWADTGQRTPAHRSLLADHITPAQARCRRPCRELPTPDSILCNNNFIFILCTGTDDTNRPRAPVGRLLAFEAATLEAEPRLGAETAAARITPVPVCPLALRAALALCGQAGSARTLQTGRFPPFHAAPASSSSAPLSVAEALTATRWPDAPMRSALHALCLTASRRRRRAPRVPAAPAAAATT